MRTFSARERRLIAVGLLIAAIAVIVLGVFVPIIGGFALRAEERSDLLATYDRNQRVLADIPNWRAEAEHQKKSEEDFAISAPTEALAAEKLKGRITQMTNNEGGTVKTISEIQGDVPEGWVKVRADLQLTMGQLYKSLSRLESEAPYVVVGYLSVAAERAAQTGHLAPMEVRIEVSAPVRLERPA